MKKKAKGKGKQRLLKVLRVIAVTLAVILLLGTGAVGYFTYAQTAELKITVSREEKLNEFDGFGTSACWWSQYCGNSPYEEEVAKLLFSREGLGLNVYRYNVGGGEADNPDSVIGRKWNRPESFYVKNEETGEYEYDFTRDANAQRMLDLALSYGVVDTVVLFANSPHYSMTVSGRASGGDEEYQSNLPRENYEAYADYFLTITEYFLSRGVPVKYISPVNEPQWEWGGEGAHQEGCHYTGEELSELFAVFARKIKERGTPVLLSGPESGDISPNTISWFNRLYKDREIREVLGTLSYHSYWTDWFLFTKPFLRLWTERFTPGVKLDMSEWCELPCKHTPDDITGALIEARVIANDLQYTGVSTWSAWAGVNGISDYTDGLLYADDDFTELHTAIRYNALAHFSKFIPAGSVRLKSRRNAFDMNITFRGATGFNFTTSEVSFLTPEGKAVTVVVNEGEERKLSFNIDAEKMTVYTSTQEAQLQNTYSGEIKTLVLPAKSIMTVVFE